MQSDGNRQSQMKRQHISLSSLLPSPLPTVCTPSSSSLFLFALSYVLIIAVFLPTSVLGLFFFCYFFLNLLYTTCKNLIGILSCNASGLICPLSAAAIIHYSTPIYAHINTHAHTCTLMHAHAHAHTHSQQVA